MEFRLTYEGPLLAANTRNRRSAHKHEIRKALHPQLKQLWQATPHLREATKPHDVLGSPSLEEYLASQFTRVGYRFVPLVTEDLSLLCSLDILFLRPDRPGSLIKSGSGDIDNRLKILFDALRMPDSKEELGHYLVPAPDEDPFYCLLQDDKLITRLAVETDMLLRPISSPNDTRLVITVRIRPHEWTWENIAFG
jgi:hypothetical protein